MQNVNFTKTICLTGFFCRKFIQKILMRFLLLLFFLMKNIFADAQQTSDTMKVYATIYKGDTIPAKCLKTVYISDFRPIVDFAQRQLFSILKSDVTIVYPYAKQTSALLIEINQHLESLQSKHERKAYIKSKEDALNKQFKNQLVNMTTRQGRILILLINRETGSTCYDLVKEFKGGFKSWVYNTMMTTYDDDLDMKRKYNAQEQFLLERAIFEIENSKKN